MAKKFFTDESLTALTDAIKSFVTRSISGKADSSHTHSISDITDLEDGFSNSTQVQIITWGADD